MKRCDSRCPGGWPIPSSVRYHALALSLRVGGGTILPTRRRRGRSTPAPVPRTDGPSAPLTSTADDPRHQRTDMGTPRRHDHRGDDHGGAQSSRTDDHTHGGDHGGDHTHGGDHGGGDHKASTLTATFLTASIEMEANQETHNQGAALYAMAPYGQAVFFCFDGVDGFDDNLDQQSGDGMSIAVLSRWRRPVVRRQFSKVGHEWRRTRGTHGGRQR